MAGSLLLYGAWSEIVAIYALYQQQAIHSTALGVFLAVTFMVIMTAAGPAVVFFRTVVTPVARGMKWIFSDAEPGASAPQPSEEGEMGKTGTEAGS